MFIFTILLQLTDQICLRADRGKLGMQLIVDVDIVINQTLLSNNKCRHKQLQQKITNLKKTVQWEPNKAHTSLLRVVSQLVPRQSYDC